jgi:uncharacterized protein YbaA (DUF1428 family)
MRPCLRKPGMIKRRDVNAAMCKVADMRFDSKRMIFGGFKSIVPI